MNGWGLMAARALSQLVSEDRSYAALAGAARQLGVGVERGGIPGGRLTRVGSQWVIMLGDHLQGWMLEYVLAHELGHFLRGPGLAEFQRRHAGDRHGLHRLARLNLAREEADAHSFAAAWLAREDRRAAERLYDLQRMEFCAYRPKVGGLPAFAVPVREESRVYGGVRAETSPPPAAPWSECWNRARPVWMAL